MASTGHSGLTWTDTRRFLADLESVLASGGDNADSLAALRAARVELQSIFTAAQSQAKRMLTELQQSVYRLETVSADTLMPIEQMRLQMDQVESKRIKLMEQISRLQQERDLSATSMQMLLTSTLVYKEQLAALSQQQSAEVPRRRHWLSLYMNVTNIRWDYDAPTNVLEGYIAPPNDLPTRPFRFDNTTLSAPALADSLWAAVGQAHGLPVE